MINTAEGHPCHGLINVTQTENIIEIVQEVAEIVEIITAGPQGAPGRDGVRGVDGINGSDGKHGQSAYEIWLSEGNSGSVSDFLVALGDGSGQAPDHQAHDSDYFYFGWSAASVVQRVLRSDPATQESVEVSSFATAWSNLSSVWGA